MRRTATRPSSRALRDAGRWLGVALASTFNLLDLEAVVLGGCFGPLAPWLVEPVRETLVERSLAARSGAFAVLPSAFGDGAAVRGAAAHLRFVGCSTHPGPSPLPQLEANGSGASHERSHRAREGGGHRRSLSAPIAFERRAGRSSVRAGGIEE